MPILAIVNLVFFAALLSLLYQFSKNSAFTLSRRVLMGLIGGIVFGMYLQGAFGGNPEVMGATLEWTNVVANSYVALLRMMIMPLILITMIAAVLKVEEIKSLGQIGGTVVGTLIVTTVIAALVGITIALLFGLNAGDLAGGEVEMARAEVLQARQGSVADLSLAELLVSFVPSNIFSDLAGQRSMSIIGVVVFGLIFGVAALLVAEDNAEQGKSIRGGVDTLQAIIMRLVKLVMALTPYGVLALMTRVIATSDGEAIRNLISFVVASYIAIAIMFAIHAAIIIGLGANIKTYFQKVWPVLTFAF
ncbi:MAG: cation:dicarboxylase symporter family transporter, partial [Gammaproteobacteria bacterium]|nr:cation:dicarboxylase symporter family transporter [Gammaproteobacteria bacterium]